MGGILFSEALPEARPQTAASQYIGGVAATIRTSITPIEVKNDRLIYGAEVPCLIWDRDHEVARKQGGMLRFRRKEFRVDEEMRGPIGHNWTFVSAWLPPSLRRVASARFQARIANRAGAISIEDAPPLLKIANAENLSDAALLDLLSSLQENVFETGRHWVASLPYGLSQEGTFTPYGIGTVDAVFRQRWASGAIRSGTAEYAFGAYPVGDEFIWEQLWKDSEFEGLLKIHTLRSWRMEGAARCEVEIELSDNVRAQIPYELHLAVRQALGGWGREADEQTGKPVIFRVRRLLERALEALHKRDRIAADTRLLGTDTWDAWRGQDDDLESRILDGIVEARRKSESGLIDDRQNPNASRNSRLRR
ncbi:hypothetical protein [Methylocapsa sp. S129]|uniref:hypothetical protein n=1 Tax=Methylocapsa sp. S129 TaxID=1641869 RepID=UPI00131B9CDA|nr:hypothetical protein [Methylocapsa sp. S129]